MEGSMGRVIIGATAIVTGLAAAVGGVVLRRRRAKRDDLLPLDPGPPPGSSPPAARDPDEAPSVEADFGQVDPPTDGTGSPAPVTRKPRAPRKTAKTTRATKSKAGKTAATKADGVDRAADPVVRPKRPTRVRTSPAATNVAESIEPATGDAADVADGS
jgi:hypothetical protein